MSYKKGLFVLGIAIFMVFSYFYFFKKKNNGIIVILNGPSASGKSSIQKDFLALMLPEFWIKLGIDNLFDSPFPTINEENLSFWQSKNSLRWVEEIKDENENKMIQLFIGNDGKKIVSGMNSAIAEYAKAGCNVIVDYIGYEKEWLHDLQTKLKGMKTIWVKVEIPLGILEKREKDRGTSPVGHARSHYDSVYGDIKYDFAVDTSKNTSKEIAQKIAEFIKK